MKKIQNFQSYQVLKKTWLRYKKRVFELKKNILVELTKKNSTILFEAWMQISHYRANFLWQKRQWLKDSMSRRLFLKKKKYIYSFH